MIQPNAQGDEHYDYLVFDLEKKLQEIIGKEGWQLVRYVPGTLLFRRRKDNGREDNQS